MYLVTMRESRRQQRSSPSHAATLGRLLAAALVVVVFVGLQVAFHGYLGRYYVPWTGVKRGESFGVYHAIAWTDRALVILFVVLLLARLVRISGASKTPARRRSSAVVVHSILLGVFLFALWLPGRGDGADIGFLIGLGALGVIFSGIVLALTRFKRRYLVESLLALLLLLLAGAGLMFFVASLALGRLD